MSGPKDGKLKSFRFEVLAEIKKISNSFIYYKNIILSKKKYLSNIINEDIKKMKEFLDIEQIDKSWKEIILSMENFLEKFDNVEKKSLKIITFDSKGLEYVKNISKEISNRFKDLDIKIKKFENFLLKEISKSKAKREQVKEEKINELKDIYENEKNFLIKWSGNENKVEEIGLEISKLLHKDYETVINDIKIINEKINELKELSLKNFSEFEKKNGISKTIMETLNKLGFENIQRKAENGILGDIVVCAETPMGDWNVSFNLMEEDNIVIDTPYDNRCYVNVQNLVDELKKEGIELDIPKLKMHKKTKKQIKGEKQCVKDVKA